MDELEGGERLEIAMEAERTVPSFCFSYAELAVRITRIVGKHEIRRLINVVSDVFFDAKELRRHVTRVEDCKCLVIEEALDALRREVF